MAWDWRCFGAGIVLGALLGWTLGWWRDRASQREIRRIVTRLSTRLDHMAQTHERPEGGDPRGACS